MKPVVRNIKFGIVALTFALAGQFGNSFAQEQPKIPDWNPSPQQVPSTGNQPPPNYTPQYSPSVIIDQSDELVEIDKAMAETISTSGPQIGYGAYISPQGVLYDAAGGSPEGQAAVQARFGTFPANITMKRRPEKAMASGGAGASWGGYSVMRGETVLSDGRYVTIWRKEQEGWKIVSELAAGRNAPPPALPTKPTTPTNAPLTPATGVGAMPKMRDALGRPIGTRQ